MKLRKTFLSAGKRRVLLIGCGLALLTAALPAQEKNLVIDLGDGVKMEFVLIPAGSFMMGFSGAEIDMEPVHKVTITKPFYIGKYEVTQEQWQALMAGNPSNFKGPKNPVEQVNWLDCQDFLTKLETKVSGMKASLPTEAQWEYACRAGSTSKYYYGDSKDDLWDYAWYDEDSKKTTHPVGEKEANAWGLYDMYGNVCEWCADNYEPFFYHFSSEQDPMGPDSGTYSRESNPKGTDSGKMRAMRGGSWADDLGHSAFRPGFPSSTRISALGFRVVLGNVDLSNAPAAKSFMVGGEAVETLERELDEAAEKALSKTLSSETVSQEEKDVSQNRWKTYNDALKTKYKATGLTNISDEDNASFYVNAFRMAIIDRENHGGWPTRYAGRKKALSTIKKKLEKNIDAVLMAAVIIPAIDNGEIQYARDVYQVLVRTHTNWAAYMFLKVWDYFSNSEKSKEFFDGIR